MTDQNKNVKPLPLKPLPLLVGPRNAEAVTGFPWRWCRDRAVALRVPFLGAGQKRALRADLFIAALERSGVTPPESDTASPAVVDCGDPAATVRAMLGKRRAAR